MKVACNYSKNSSCSLHFGCGPQKRCKLDHIVTDYFNGPNYCTVVTEDKCLYTCRLCHA